MKNNVLSKQEALQKIHLVSEKKQKQKQKVINKIDTDLCWPQLHGPTQQR